ncbi:MAG: hydroxyethylthiazole kinase [Lachnospiraceae bacterium]|nr:hydroxyethylthiazole kinase [Lachnospiraceae bacterium]
MWKELLENVRKRAPRIHCITNYVSMNDCANILLACGASPIMAMDEAETAQITSICDGLTINIGTLSRAAIPAMLASGKRANELGIPVVLDPVGTGASDFRTESAVRLLEEIRFTAIRGNASELRALSTASADALKPHTRSERKERTEGCSEVRPGMGEDCCASGVDVSALDRVTEDNLDRWLSFVKDFAGRTGAVIALTGPIDLVADEDRALLIRNGHPMMSRVTGTGCQLSALTTAFLAANPISRTGAEEKCDHLHPVSSRSLLPVAAAICAMGVCGERAQRRLTELDGNATYRNYIIDAVYHLTPEELETEAKYEMR